MDINGVTVDIDFVLKTAEALERLLKSSQQKKEFRALLNQLIAQL